MVLIKFTVSQATSRKPEAMEQGFKGKMEHGSIDYFLQRGPLE
jgi:hypothetical protein